MTNRDVELSEELPRTGLWFGAAGAKEAEPPAQDPQEWVLIKDQQVINVIVATEDFVALIKDAYDAVEPRDNHEGVVTPHPIGIGSKRTAPHVPDEILAPVPHLYAAPGVVPPDGSAPARVIYEDHAHDAPETVIFEMRIPIVVEHLQAGEKMADLVGSKEVPLVDGIAFLEIPMHEERRVDVYCMGLMTPVHGERNHPGVAI